MILRSTRVALPSGVQPADIHVLDGRIAAVVAPAPEAALTTPPFALRPPPPAPRPPLHDVGDLVVFPGLVDTHVHVNDPGRTDWEGFETATRAAAAGGVTTIVDMPLNSIPPTVDVAALNAKRAAARGRVFVDVAFWGGAIPGNAAALAALADAGVCGFKCFLVPSGVDEFPAVRERDLRAAMPILRARGLPLLVHAESPAALMPMAGDPAVYTTWAASRPPRAEIEAIDTMIALARECATHIHIVHLAAGEAIGSIAAARRSGVRITVETCPHYLTFDEAQIANGATLFKCAPPLRSAANREALWTGLADGVIDMIASDHSPCPRSMKAGGDFARAWGGIASIELTLRAVWTGARERDVGLAHIANWLSAQPARLAGLGARKGSIEVGKDADLVIWDPDQTNVVDERRLHQRHTRTPYAGRPLSGRVIETYVRGRLVYRDGSGPDGIVGDPAGSLLSHSS
ncbi:MAG: allantoinase AllB [Vicinamibacterales bacterium]